MKTKTAYDDLHLVPTIIATTVADEPYTGSEMSSSRQSFVDKVEAYRAHMDRAEVDEFATYVDNRCRSAYEAGTDYFMECVSATGNKGRDQLHVWAKHWLASFICKKNGWYA